jgi:hypothetical protein
MTIRDFPVFFLTTCLSIIFSSGFCFFLFFFFPVSNFICVFSLSSLIRFLEIRAGKTSNLSPPSPARARLFLWLIFHRSSQEPSTWLWLWSSYLFPWELLSQPHRIDHMGIFQIPAIKSSFLSSPLPSRPPVPKVDLCSCVRGTLCSRH